MTASPSLALRFFRRKRSGARTGLAVLAIGLCPPVLRGAEAPPPGHTVEAASADPWDSAMARDLRNPFLPVGYRPPAEQPAGEDTPGAGPAVPKEASDEQWSAARARLLVQGVSRRGTDMAALVNGRVVTVGDDIEMAHERWRFRWRVTSVDFRSGLGVERLNATPEAAVNGGRR